jgi:hypothetical protein
MLVKALMEKHNQNKAHFTLPGVRAEKTWGHL